MSSVIIFDAFGVLALRAFAITASVHVIVDVTGYFR